MSWKESFQQGIAHYQAFRVAESIQSFTSAIELGGNHYAIHDSRAAAYDKLGQLKSAIADARKVIQLAPEKWQGYSRSAQLFHRSHKYEAAIKMVDHALARLKPKDASRRQTLDNLRKEAIQARDAEVEQQRRAASKVAYHFGKLPVELCGQVFMEVVAEEWHHLFVLLRVCSKWRATVCEMPSLWSTLLLSHKKPVAKAALWLKRSNRRIETLQLDKVHNDLDWNFEALDTLAWEHLSVLRFIELPQATITYIMPSIPKMTRLLDLQLQSNSPRFNVDEIFCQAKDLQLQHLSLDKCYFTSETLITHIKTLLSISLQGSILNGCLVDILQANPLLERISVVDLVGRNPIPHPEPRSIQLPSLAHLSLAGPFHSNPIEFLDVPRLQTLMLKRFNCANAVFLDLIERGESMLTSLSVQYTVVSSAPLVTFLKLCPLLQKLELTDVSIGMNDVVEALTDTILSGSVALCPLLSHLDVSNCPDIKTGPLVRFVKARRPPVEAETTTAEAPEATVPQFPCLLANGHNKIDVDWFPWFKANVKTFSCILPKTRWKK